MKPDTICRYFLLVLFMVALAACGGTPDDPAGATKAWMTAAVEGNDSLVRENTCSQLLSQFDSVVGMVAAIGLVGDLGIEVDISGLQYTTLSQQDDNAEVRVHGQVKTTVLGISQTDGMEQQISLVRESGRWKVCE